MNPGLIGGIAGCITGVIGGIIGTGKKVQVPPKRLPLFKPGKELKERVDYPAK